MKDFHSIREAKIKWMEDPDQEMKDRFREKIKSLTGSVGSPTNEGGIDYKINLKQSYILISWETHAPNKVFFEFSADLRSKVWTTYSMPLDKFEKLKPTAIKKMIKTCEQLVLADRAIMDAEKKFENDLRSIWK